MARLSRGSQPALSDVSGCGAKRALNIQTLRTNARAPSPTPPPDPAGLSVLRSVLRPTSLYVLYIYIEVYICVCIGHRRPTLVTSLFSALSHALLLYLHSYILRTCVGHRRAEHRAADQHSHSGHIHGAVFLVCAHPCLHALR